MPSKAELLKLREAREYWKRYARFFPRYRIEKMEGRDSCVLLPLDRRAGLPPVTLTPDVVAAFEAIRNEGRAHGEAQTKG